MKTFARRLRRNQTDCERRMWFELRDRRFQGLKFRRQMVMGPYIVDFCCPEKKAIVEIDGGHHNIPVNKKRDRERTTFLEAKGYQVIRFWDNEVTQNMNGVLESLRLELANPHPDPLPLKKGEGENRKSGKFGD